MDHPSAFYTLTFRGALGRRPLERCRRCGAALAALLAWTQEQLAARRVVALPGGFALIVELGKRELNELSVWSRSAGEPIDGILLHTVEPFGPDDASNRATTAKPAPPPPLLPPESRAPVGQLLQRMSIGDRSAAAEFVILYGPQIRRRIRGKLRVNMRRLFDSQDILSTLGRRLDHLVASGQFEARSEWDLWSLVFTLAEQSVAEKTRVWRALTESETDQPDPALGDDSEFDWLLERLPASIDRLIARLWAQGMASEAIALELGLTPEAIRRHWRRIREMLRRRFEDGREEEGGAGAPVPC